MCNIFLINNIYLNKTYKNNFSFTNIRKYLQYLNFRLKLLKYKNILSLQKQNIVIEMDKKHYLLILVLLIFTSAFAQEYNWQVGIDYFFDNTEYKKSSFIDSETMNGVWLNPAGSITWNETHSLNAGVNLLKIPGMDKMIDEAKAIIYYQYSTPNILFRAGSFPKDDLLNNYNNFFFKDSVNNFLPHMDGVYFRIGNNNNFLNAWFYRTGYATANSREHFFVGVSGRASRGIYFADFQSYMYHLSNTKPATEGYGVSENLQLQATLGLEYNDEEKFNGLIAAGTLLGYERDRRFENQKYKPMGFVARADAEIMGIGTKNLLYIGDPRMRLSDSFGGDLYWGTQFLRAKTYLKNEWYIRLIESENVKVRFNCNLHFNEGYVMMQQALTVSASIDNLKKSKNNNTIYPWKKIFK